MQYNASQCIPMQSNASKDNQIHFKIINLILCNSMCVQMHLNIMKLSQKHSTTSQCNQMNLKLHGNTSECNSKHLISTASQCLSTPMHLKTPTKHVLMKTIVSFTIDVAETSKTSEIWRSLKLLRFTIKLNS